MRAVGGMILALAPLPCLAEGAVQLWDCEATAFCDFVPGRDAACTATERVPHRFEIAPLQTDADGRGSYRITHNAAAFGGEGRSFAGPFEWRQDDALLHSLRADPRPDNQVTFDLIIAPTDGSAPMTRTLLDCEVTQ